MTRTLLQTKFFVPAPRPSLVPRPALWQRLTAALPGKLILVAAPAGSGKSTLVADWARQQHGPDAARVCWLSLDAAENSVIPFLAYVAGALQQAQPQLDTAFLADLPSAIPPADLPVLLTPLLNELASLTEPLVLVLDDYQKVDSTAVDEVLRFLIEQLPPAITLVVLTRLDPPWPLARWRASGDMLELRGADLRFSMAEAEQFLNEGMGLNLTAADVAALEQRTEGWIAGLSLRDHADVPAFIAAFTGSHRHVLDYLLSEVLAQQAPQVRDFLLRTAVLDRLCAPLCAALLDDVDPVQAQDILETLEAANLFLIGLDAERRWYRTHHLFADALRSQIGTLPALDPPDLHRRAAVWYAENDLPRDAVSHALQAPDYSLAGLIIQDNWRRLFHQGWLSTTLQWLESLPPTLLQRLPPLSVAACWSLAVRGEYGRIPPYLAQAEAALQTLADAGTLPQEQLEYRMLQGQFALLHAVLARAAGDGAAAVVQIEQAMASLPDVQARLGPQAAALGAGSTALQLGYAHLTLQEPAQAAAQFEASQEASQRAGNIFGAAAAVLELTRIQVARGQAAAAEQTCRRFLALADQPQYAGWPAFCLAEIGLALALLAGDRAAAAAPILARGLGTARRSGHLYYLAFAHHVAQQIHQQLGDRIAAQAAAAAASRLLRSIDRDPAVFVAPLGAAGLIEPLTEREQDILRLLARGLTNEQIAAELFVSRNTVKTHTKNLYGKLAVHNRTQAVRRAQELGLIPPAA